MEFEGKAMPENEIPDWQEDVSSHVKLKNRVLRSTTEKFEYFNSLSQDFVVPNPSGEPAWVQFLDGINGFVKRLLLKSQEINRDEEGEEENGHHVNKTEDYSKDAQYKIFFENFRLDGRSYVLEIAQDNAFVRYDAGNNELNSGKNTDFGEKHVSLETNVSSEAEKQAPEDAGLAVDVVEKYVSFETNVSSEAEKHAPKNVGLAVDVGEKHVSFETNVSSEAEKHVPENVGLAVDAGEKHVSLEINVSSEAGKNEQENVGLAVDVGEKHVSLETNVSSEAEKNEPEIVGLAVDVGEKHVYLQTNVSSEAENRAQENVGLAVDVGKKHVSFETNVGSEAEMQVSENEGICVQVRRRGRPKRVSKSAPNIPTRVAGTSTKRVKVNLRNQNGREVSDVSSDMDIKEEIDEGDPPNRKSPVANPILNVEKWWHSHNVNKKKKSEFREKLMDILQKPYCEEEHETLYKEISHRKPVQHKRVLRSQTKIYEDKRAGKSFLDHYTDLAKIIDSVRDDQPRVLNLLRGFFYWMMNLSHEGAIKPWKDLTCLKVLPATK